LLFLPSHRAACASRSPDTELHGDPVNEPSGAFQKVRELLVGQRWVGDYQVTDRLVRLRRARSFHETNVNHFGVRSFDLAVSTHNYPSERGIEKMICNFTGDIEIEEIPAMLGIL
jgi:hypothetical protein